MVFHAFGLVYIFVFLSSNNNSVRPRFTSLFFISNSISVSGFQENSALIPEMLQTVSLQQYQSTVDNQQKCKLISDKINVYNKKELQTLSKCTALPMINVRQK